MCGLQPPGGGSGVSFRPPHTIISDPVQTAVCRKRSSRKPGMAVGVHVFEVGSYWPPSRNDSQVPPAPASPPHTIIRVPVQTAVWDMRPGGEAMSETGLQWLLMGSYRPPSPNLL